MSRRSRPFSRWITFTLALVSPVLAETAAMLSGHWVQVLSDTFVQSTTEVDWHCVQVDIKPQPQPPAPRAEDVSNATSSSYLLTKTARLHAPDGPVVTTPEVELVVQEERARVYRPLLLDGRPYETYAVRRQTSDMLVLTGEDDADASLYVLVRDADAFEADAGGRRTELEAELAAWGYTDAHTYKEPRASFDVRRCDGDGGRAAPNASADPNASAAPATTP